MKYVVIRDLAKEYSVSRLCRLFNASRSGFIAWMTRGPSKRETSNEALVKLIKKCHVMSRGTYGSHRTWNELHKSGIPCSEKRIARLMKDAGICGVVRRKHRQTPLDTNAASYPKNLIARDFSAEAANLKWVTDITYIPTDQGWLYMSVVMDLYSRRIVGWSFHNKLDASIVTRALVMAISQRNARPGLLVHSDKGSQFASDVFQKQLADNKFVQSMSRKGDCWDNAAMESFFGTLKQELVHRVKYQTRRSAIQDIFQWIETWYNRHRRHSYLGYESPDNFEKASLRPNPITTAA